MAYLKRYNESWLEEKIGIRKIHQKPFSFRIKPNNAARVYFPYSACSKYLACFVLSTPTEQGAGSDDAIPDWIKNTAGWWADGQIDDNSFVSGLQWLISNGIMKVS